MPQPTLTGDGAANREELNRVLPKIQASETQFFEAGLDPNAKLRKADGFRRFSRGRSQTSGWVLFCPSEAISCCVLQHLRQNAAPPLRTSDLDRYSRKLLAWGGILAIIRGHRLILSERAVSATARFGRTPAGEEASVSSWPRLRTNA
jgi:hypothetical protein